MNKKNIIKSIFLILLITTTLISLFVFTKNYNNKIIKISQNLSQEKKYYTSSFDELYLENKSLNEKESNKSLIYNQNLTIEIIDELINRIMFYINNSILDNCSIIGSYEFNQTSKKYEPSSYGPGYFILYDFSEIYKKTKNRTYLKMAEKQRHCIENYHWPENYDSERLFILSTIVWAESSYYEASLEKPPEKLEELSYFVLKNNNYRKEFYLQAQDVVRKVLALTSDYSLTNKKEFYDEAKKLMINLEKNRENKTLNDYVKAELLRAWCEIYKRKNEREILDYINKNFQILLGFKNKDGSFGNPESAKTLITYQALGALDSCYEATGEEVYRKEILGTINFLLNNTDNKQGGIIELENKKTISLNTEILKVLLKLKQTIKNE
jgi:hypothetical protein